jgi:dihydrofolate synthase/folylpolyglutamate synthase
VIETMSAWNRLLGEAAAARPGRRNRLARFSRILNLYQSKFGPVANTIKITGTSGKGSVCALLEAMFLRDGKKVCTFTSPHLVTPCERIRLNGRAVSEEIWNDAAAKALPFIREIVTTLGEACQPSFFETVLLLALQISRSASVDLLILEVAVGGYNDVVALFPSPLAAITTVGLDHREELGASIADIAADKAGIASNGSTLVLGPAIGAEAQCVILADGTRRGVAIVRPDQTRIARLESSQFGFKVRVGGQQFRLSLPGAFQIDNLATAVALFDASIALGWAHSQSSIAGASDAHWPARLELIPGAPNWLLDAGHNSLAFGELRKYLEEYYADARIAFVFGASEKDKANDGLRIFSPIAAKIFLTSGFYRSAIGTIEELHLPASVTAKITFSRSPVQSLDLVHSSEGQFDLVVVTGSIFLVGCWRELSTNQSSQTQLEPQ